MTYSKEVLEHPLTKHLLAAVEQAMSGKGRNHGGASSPFMDQPWVHRAKMHGRGFLTGQASKKIEAAASCLRGEAFTAEVTEAIVYLGMALIGEAIQSDLSTTTKPVVQATSVPIGSKTP